MQHSTTYAYARLQLWGCRYTEGAASLWCLPACGTDIARMSDNCLNACNHHAHTYEYMSHAFRPLSFNLLGQGVLASFEQMAEAAFAAAYFLCCCTAAANTLSAIQLRRQIAGTT